MAASLNEDCGSPGQGPSGRGPSGRDESTKRTLVLLTDDCAAAEVVGARSRSISPRRSGMRSTATSVGGPGDEEMILDKIVDILGHEAAVRGFSPDESADRRARAGR